MSELSEIILENAVLRYPVSRFIKGSLKSGLLQLFGYSGEAKPPIPHHTALDHVNLHIRTGERVGLIGHNGAGKSSLLRAVAGIYPLAEGEIRVRGRIQSIFELGLGFEHDSSGRENIYYRGLAMGNDPSQIAARTQEIIDFAEIGEFIDLPIRVYSAGMFVRLAFAISTFLDGDILLIDEVFGAGDARFVDKATKRMQNIVNSAHIVLLVSHDMELMRQICKRIIWLDHGHVRMDGPAEAVIDAYRHAVSTGHVAGPVIAQGTNAA